MLSTVDRHPQGEGTASDAAAPIACPIAVQMHWARIPAKAIRLAETFLPATVILRLPLGMSARNGTFQVAALQLGRVTFGTRFGSSGP